MPWRRSGSLVKRELWLVFWAKSCNFAGVVKPSPFGKGNLLVEKHIFGKASNHHLSFSWGGWAVVGGMVLNKIVYVVMINWWTAQDLGMKCFMIQVLDRMPAPAAENNRKTNTGADAKVGICIVEPPPQQPQSQRQQPPPPRQQQQQQEEEEATTIDCHVYF